MKRLLRIDWDVIAGITAALIAVVLHLLHVVDVDILFTIVLVLLALVLFRDLQRESHDEHLGEAVDQIKGDASGKVLEPRWRTLPQTVSFIDIVCLFSSGGSR